MQTTLGLKFKWVWHEVERTLRILLIVPVSQPHMSIPKTKKSYMTKQVLVIENISYMEHISSWEVWSDKATEMLII